MNHASIRRILFIIVFFGLVGCSSASLNWGNTPGNIANFAYRVEVKDGILFANSRDHYRIYRSRKDGSQVQKLSEQAGVYLNVSGDWVYFMRMEDDHAIVRLKTDGSMEEVISENSVLPLGGMLLAKEWIYYVNGDDQNRIYRMSLDGKINELLIDVSALRLNGCDDGLVYIEVNESGNVLRLSSWDGSQIKMLAQDVGELTLPVDDWVYFNKASDQQKLYRVKTDGSGEQKVNDLRVSSINTHQGWLYFSDLGHDYRLSRAKLDGTSVEVISNDSSSDFLFIDGWLYYLNLRDSGREYRLKGDQNEAVIAVAMVTPLAADESEFEGVSNSNANILNGGFVVSIGDQVILAQSDGVYGLNVNDPASEIVKLSTDVVRHLNVWKDWVYYINESDALGVYRMRADGSEPQLVLDQSVGNLMIRGNWMYFTRFTDNQRIYRAKVDGSQLSAISQAQGLFSFSIDGDWLVYADAQGQQISKVRMDGTQEQVIASIPSTYLMAFDGWIYYGDDNSQVALSKVTLDGQNNQKLITHLASHVHVSSDVIFYVDSLEEVIVRMDHESNQKTVITPKGDYAFIHRVNDRLFVFDNQRFQWLTMDIDGEDIRVLE